MKTQRFLGLVFLLAILVTHVPVGHEGLAAEGQVIGARVHAQAGAVDDGDKRDEVLALITGTTYYLDAVNGNDEDDGSSAHPWQSLQHAQSVVQSGDGVILRTGNYGEYVESDVARTAWVVYINEVGATPVFSRIRVRNTTPTDTYLVFYGIDVSVEWVDPASSGEPGSDDPYYPNSTTATYAKTADPVHLRYVNYFQVHNGVLSGTDKNLTVHGCFVENSDNVLVEHNEIKTVQVIVQMQGTDNLTIRNNHGHEHTSTCFKMGNSGVTNTLIEGNHCHDSNWDVGEPYTPRAPGSTYHGSAISIRNGTVTIRNNIFHDGWGSSGIMTYTDAASASAYSDILFENNLMYDIHNNYVLRIYRLGENVVVRNNTLVGHIREDTAIGTYKYETALTVSALADGYDGSGFSLYNNVLVGASYIGLAANGQEDHNIFWSMNSGGWVCDEDLTNHSKIVTCGYPIPDYFVNGFFREDPDLTEQHGQTIDFRLADGSEGIGFGSPAHQPSDSLGTLDAQGFVQQDGPARNGYQHSAGSYEVAGLGLYGTPGDQAIYLDWDVETTLPVTTNWQIDYYSDTLPSLVLTETNSLSATRAYTLTGLTNYAWYTVTLHAMVDSTSFLSDTVRVMPTDRFVYLPLVEREE